jgi:4-hydroxy-tetrahydrodipicolinate synthase
VHHPVMLYNIPSRAGVPLHPETVKNLSQHKKFTSIKDSSGSLDYIMEYKKVAPHIDIFCGDDGMINSMQPHDIKGLVSVVSNLYPVFTRQYVVETLQRLSYLDTEWAEKIQFLNRATNPIPVKALMQEMGLITSSYTRLPLSLQDMISTKSF